MKRSYQIACLLAASFGVTLTGCAGLDQDRTAFRQTRSQPIGSTASALKQPAFNAKQAPFSLNSTSTLNSKPESHEGNSKTLAKIPANTQPEIQKKVRTVVFDEIDLEAAQPIAFQDSSSGNSVTIVGSNEVDATFEESLTLAALEQMALAANPAISASLANIEKSNGLLQQVGTPANPTIGYFGQQLADEGTAQNGFYIDQEIVRGNKLALNQQVLCHTTQAQSWELEAQRYRVLTDVRVAFYAAIVAQKELDAILEFSTVADKGVDFAEKRLEAGEGTKIDVLQSRTLLSEINLAREQAIVAYRGAWQTLVAVAGVSNPQPVRLIGEISVSDQSPNWESTYHEILGNSPELKVAQEVLAEKQALLQRQLAQTIPNLETQIGAGYDSATNSGMLNLQIGAPIPMRNKNCGNIAAARGEIHMAIENVRRIEQSIKSRLATAAQEYDAASAAVQRYSGEIIPQAEEAMQLSEEGYLAGELEFLQTLVIRRSYYDATIKLAQAQGRLAQSEAKINGLLLSGGLEAHTDYASDDGLRGQSLGGQ